MSSRYDEIQALRRESERCSGIGDSEGAVAARKEADALEAEEKKPRGLDYGLLANGVEQLREALNAAVAGLVADGFTDREARMIIAGLMASQASQDEQES